MGGRVPLELSGHKYGKLTVISKVGTGRGGMWSCQCDCGNKRAVNGSHLKNGHTKSCGCWHPNTRRGDGHHAWKGGRLINTHGYSIGCCEGQTIQPSKTGTFKSTAW